MALLRSTATHTTLESSATTITADDDDSASASANAAEYDEQMMSASDAVLAAALMGSKLGRPKGTKATANGSNAGGVDKNNKNNNRSGADTDLGGRNSVTAASAALGVAVATARAAKNGCCQEEAAPSNLATAIMPAGYEVVATSDAANNSKGPSMTASSPPRRPAIALVQQVVAQHAAAEPIPGLPAVAASSEIMPAIGSAADAADHAVHGAATAASSTASSPRGSKPPVGPTTSHAWHRVSLKVIPGPSGTGRQLLMVQQTDVTQEVRARLFTRIVS